MDCCGNLKADKSKRTFVMALPMVSVVTVVFNGKEFIERTLKSVLMQDYSNIEYHKLPINSETYETSMGTA